MTIKPLSHFESDSGTGKPVHRKLLPDDRFDFEGFGIAEIALAISLPLLVPVAVLVKLLVS